MREKFPVLPAFLLGLTSIGAQVVLIREFLAQSYGNELIIGLLFSEWMILTGLGAHLGRRFAGREFSRISLVVAIAALPCIAILLWVALSIINAFGISAGTSMHVWMFLPVSFLLMACICLPSGMLFVLLCDHSENINHRVVNSQVYLWESLGSAAGGMVASVLLVPFVSSFETLLLLLMLGSILAAAALRRVYRFPVLLPAVGLFLTATAFLANVEYRITALLYPGQNLLLVDDTPYGKLIVSDQNGQLSTFANHRLLSTSGDVVAAEEPVHYAMAQCPQPRSILVLGGGMRGVVDEILKYGDVSVDYVDRDQSMIHLMQAFVLKRPIPNVRIICADGRRYLRDTHRNYDVVLILQSPPSTLQENRFYTKEFFLDLHAHLRPGGIVSFPLLPEFDYYGSEAQALSASLFETLKTVFARVIIVPGRDNYFIASDSSLTLDVTRAIAIKRIATDYVNQYYIDDAGVRERSAALRQSFPRDATVNSDLAPVAFSRQISFWLREQDVSLWSLLAAVLLLSVMAVRRMSAASFPMLTAGFSGSAGHMLLLLGFQISFGSLYQMLGLLIALFMIGLAIGARRGIAKDQRGKVKTILVAQRSLACILLFLLPLWWLGPDTFPYDWLFALFLAFDLCIGYQVGVLFAAGTFVAHGNAAVRAAEMYSVDLVGSALGAILCTLLLIPYLGIVGTSITLAALMFVSSIDTYIRIRGSPRFQSEWR